MDIEKVASAIVDPALIVHKTIGPDLLESTCQAMLFYEFLQRKLAVINEIPFPVVYKGIKIDAGYRIDMLVESSIIVENKAADRILPIHRTQLLMYLKISNLILGFLINWNNLLIKNGLIRMANHHPATQH